MTPAQYTQRAKLAYAAAEAAADPRDKEAFRAAAKTWERLARPTADTYSLEPLRRDLDALKRDVATAIDAPASAPAVAEVVTAAAHGIHTVKRVSRSDQFNVIDEYVRSGIEF